MSGETRRRQGFFAAIVADPWRKLLAIGLAVLSWFFISSRINQTITRPVSLATLGTKADPGQAINRLAVVLPDDRVVFDGFFDGDRKIDKVEIDISGPRFKVEAWENRILDLQVTSIDWSGRTSVEFTDAELPRDLRALQDLRIVMRPPRVRLDVKRLGEHEFPLTLAMVELEAGALANRLRSETVEFVPQTAVVIGPQDELARFASSTDKKFRAKLPQTVGDRQVSATLELIDGTAPRLRLASQHVLTMQVLPQTSKFELELPLLVDDLALPPELRGAYLPEAKTRMVRILAGGELRTRIINLGEGGDSVRIAEWASANLRLWVHVPRAEPGVGYPIELDRPARLLLGGRLHDSVDRNECLLDETVVVKLRRKP
jgi:hypothetical protein